MQLCMQFQTTIKEYLSISTYFYKMKKIADTLTMVGSFVSDDDFTFQLLSRLPLEYDVMIANINLSHASMTIEEVQSLLLNHEMRIIHATPTKVPLDHVADRSKGNQQSFSHHNSGCDSMNNFSN